MDALRGDIRPVSREDPEIRAILARHLALVRATSPACSVHAMDAGAPAAAGGLKRSGADHAEIGSMHVPDAARGGGVARRLLAHLIEAAQAAAVSRLSLETGAQDVFAPARAPRASEGFSRCAALAGCRPDPASVFMTRAP